MIHQGNSLDVLRTLPSNSVHSIVTSPPYWSLRDYGVPATIWGGDASCRHTWKAEPTAEGYTSKRKWQHQSVDQSGVRHVPSRSTDPQGWAQISRGRFCTRCGAWLGCLGLEPTPELYVHHLVAILEEGRRVLRHDGTLWLNLGDSYAAAGGRGSYTGGESGLQGSKQHQEESKRASAAMAGHSFRRDRAQVGTVKHIGAPGLKPKDLVGIPWMVAFALRARGWYLRSDIIWAKTNPMPESIKDRPTKSHEYLFLLSKTENYYYDADAIREAHLPDSVERCGRARTGGKHQDSAGGQPRGNPHSIQRNVSNALSYGGRNRRTVWSLPTSPFPEAHFATFPPGLVEPCILASTSAHGCCASCGAPFERDVTRGAELRAQKIANGCNKDGRYHGKARKNYAAARAQNPRAVKARILKGMKERITVGWRQTCRCRPVTTKPCVVLDPFAGSATTGMVCDRTGREFIGIELNPAFVKMGNRRRLRSEASA